MVLGTTTGWAAATGFAPVVAAFLGFTAALLVATVGLVSSLVGLTFLPVIVTLALCGSVTGLDEGLGEGLYP